MKLLSLSFNRLAFRRFAAHLIVNGKSKDIYTYIYIFEKDYIFANDEKEKSTVLCIMCFSTQERGKHITGAIYD